MTQPAKVALPDREAVVLQGRKTMIVQCGCVGKTQRGMAGSATQC